MKTTFRWVLASLLLLGVDSFAQEQAPAVTHNTWTSGSPMTTPVAFGAAAVLKNQVYVVGGNDAAGNNASGVVADVQVYNPTTNSRSAGVPYPTTIEAASAAVGKNILYVSGGSPDAANPTNAIWAFNPKAKKWSGEAAMPTARWAVKPWWTKRRMLSMSSGG